MSKVRHVTKVSSNNSKNKDKKEVALVEVKRWYLALKYTQDNSKRSKHFETP